MRKLRVIWQGTFVVFCYIVFTQGLADEGTDGIRTSLEADDLAVVSAGEKVYQENCASCHGAFGEPVLANAGDLRNPELALEQRITTITNGLSSLLIRMGRITQN